MLHFLWAGEMTKCARKAVKDAEVEPGVHVAVCWNAIVNPSTAPPPFL